MTTKKETIEALEKARNELLKEENQKDLEGWSRTVQFYFKDIEEYWHFEVNEGVPGPLVNEEADDADIRIKMDEETFLGIMAGKINRMTAFTSGKVKVKAALKDISKLTKFM